MLLLLPLLPLLLLLPLLPLLLLLLPLLLRQATQRATFLRDCKRPMTALGPFWGRVNLVVRRFQRQPVAEEEEAHND